MRPPWSHTARSAAQVALLAMACSAPVFALTVRSWASALLALCALLAIVLLPGLPAHRRATRTVYWDAAVLLGLVLPLVAAVVSGLARGDLEWPHLDAPFRFLVAVPVFLYFRRSGVDPLPLLRVTLPLALLATLLHLLVEGGQTSRWGSHRMATELADPLTFGFVSLAFGLCCLMAVQDTERFGRHLWTWVLLAAACMAAALSISSGSRTGWVAVPLVVGYWLHRRFGLAGKAGVALSTAVPIVALVLLYLTVPQVQVRVDAGLQEVRQYAWSGVTPADTSIGLRITFLRMAVELFVAHPWFGIGDTTKVAASAYPAFSYASPQAVATAFQAAFHNQIVSNAVRMGLPGLVATSLLLLAPLAVALRALSRRHREAVPVARLAFAFGVTMVASSLTTEIVDLKFMASFYALMVALFTGAVLGAEDRAAAAVAGSPATARP